MTTLYDIPIELFTHILSNLSYKSLPRIYSTSKYFKLVLSNLFETSIDKLPIDNIYGNKCKYEMFRRVLIDLRINEIRYNYVIAEVDKRIQLRLI
jgi:hypothetical protein